MILKGLRQIVKRTHKSEIEIGVRFQGAQMLRTVHPRFT